MDAGDYWFASAWVFELIQFLDNEINQLFVLCWLHDSGGFDPF